MREILGSGTLFANAQLLLGKSMSFLELQIIPDYSSFLILVLPPGGFIMLGFLLALKAIIDGKGAKPKPVDTDHERIEQVFTASTLTGGRQAGAQSEA